MFFLKGVVGIKFKMSIHITTISEFNMVLGAPTFNMLCVLFSNACFYINHFHSQCFLKIGL